MDNFYGAFHHFRLTATAVILFHGKERLWRKKKVIWTWINTGV